MKILYVNWAPLWRGAEVGGGVNLYSQSMAAKFVQFGHELYSISSGYAYDFKPGTYIKNGPDFMGVKNYEVFNSPNLAPGFFNYDNPEQDVSEPVIESLFEKFLKKLKPDIVHFHNIEGFSAKCILVARKSGARVIFSLHNYHPVCNQIYLLYKDRDICTDFENGKKCIDCISPPSYGTEILQRRCAYHINRSPFGRRLLTKGMAAARFRIAPKVSDIFKKNSFVEKEINRDRHLLYAKRRKDNIEALNNAHLVHAVSKFVKDFYVEQGIKGSLITTCHIGNRMAEKMPTVCSVPLNFSSDKPVNIIFMGIASIPKGLPFLLETLLLMDKSTLKKISLHIHARGVFRLKKQLSLLSKLLFSLNAHDGYDYNLLPDILSGMDYGVVPPLWYDNAPQVVFEMMAMKVPVIGADIGGIPDFVKDLENGLLFKPGSCEDLSAKLEMAVKNKNLNSLLIKNISPMKTPDQHAKDLKGFYRLLNNPLCIPLSDQIENIFSPDPDYFAWLVKNKLTDNFSQMTLCHEKKREVFFSVVMPVYNTEPDILKRAVLSVVKQNYCWWELLVCDDASYSAQTLRALEKLTTRDSRIRLFSNKKNCGISDSTNICVEKASGDFILFLDHDDELYLDALLKIKDFVEKNPDKNLFYSDEDRISPEGYKYRYNFKPGFSPSLLETHNYILHLVCIKKELFQRTGGLKKEFDGSQDYDLLLRLMDMGEEFVHIPDILYSWRESETSMIGGGVKPEIFASGKRALAEHYKRTEEKVEYIKDNPDDLQGVYRTIFSLPEKTDLLIVKIGEQDFMFDVFDLPDCFGVNCLTWSREESFPLQAAETSADLVIFLHCSVFPQSWYEFVKELGSLALRKSVGVAGAFVFSEDNKIISAGRSLMPWGEVRNDYWGAKKESSTFNKRQRDVFSVSGIAMAVSANLLQTVLSQGKLTPDCWDIELCIRLTQEDKRVVFDPHASATCKGLFVNYDQSLYHDISTLTDKYKIKKSLLVNSNLIDCNKGPSYEGGLPSQYQKVFTSESSVKKNDFYHNWLKFHAPDLKESIRRIEKMNYKPYFSIILPTYNSGLVFFKELIDSLKSQTYTNFEICISDDASTDKEFLEFLKEVSSESEKIDVIFSDKNIGIAGNTNRAIDIAKGDFLLFCDHDDLMELFALEFIAHYINTHSGADVIYSDEDMIDQTGWRHSPRLHPDWNPDMLMSHMYCPHIVCVKKETAQRAGLLNSEMDGAQDYDFFLRVTEKAEMVGHVSMVLYSWRSVQGSVACDASAKTYAYDAGKRALEQAMERRGEKGNVFKASGTGLGVYRVKRCVDSMSVSHIIEAGSVHTLSLISNIRNLSSIPVEIILVCKNGDQHLPDNLTSHSNIRIVKVHADANRSEIYNTGAGAASKDNLLFSSKYIDLLDSDYPFALLEHTQRSEIGASGIKIIYPNGYYYHTGMILGVNGVAGYAHRNIWQYPGYWNFASCIRNYSAVSWDFMGISNKKFNEVHGFDEKLSQFGDVDLCLKLIQKGYRNLYTPYVSAVLNRPVHSLEELRNAEEEKILLEFYSDYIQHDPMYHPLMSKDLEDFSLGR